MSNCNNILAKDAKALNKVVINVVFFCKYNLVSYNV